MSRYEALYAKLLFSQSEISQEQSWIVDSDFSSK